VCSSIQLKYHLACYIIVNFDFNELKTREYITYKKVEDCLTYIDELKQ